MGRQTAGRIGGQMVGGHGEVDIGGIRMEEWNRTGGRMMNELGWKEGEQDKNQWVRY